MSGVDLQNRVNRISLRPFHRAVFVHGFGGSSKDAEEQTHALSTYIYSHSPLEDSKIGVVNNKAKKFHDSCPEATDCLLGCIWEVAVSANKIGGNSDERVGLVIFCHSNGSKPVQNALTPDHLTELCDVMGINVKDRANFMGEIRKRIAVISFGGVTYIPDKYAKVVLNFCSTSDNFSKICHLLRIGTQPKDEETNPKTYVRDPATPNKEEGVPRGFGKSIETISCISGTSRDLSARSCGTSDALNHPHYLKNILKNRNMILYIRDVLGLSGNGVNASLCSTSCSNRL